MARKAESGIDYFPINTDIIHNPKVKLVVAEFGSKTTWAVLLPLYCKIYREKGYWIDWSDEDSKLLFAQDECKLELTVVNEVVQGCVRRFLFNKEVFDMFGVLTSDRIQENYIEATSRRKNVEIIEDFLVKNDSANIKRENVNIIPLNVNIISKKVDTGTQKKKEKEKEIQKEKEIASQHPPEVLESFKKFNEWIDANAPDIKKLKYQITIDQFVKLKMKYPKMNVVTDMLRSMHNYKPLTKSYVDAYLTLTKWLKRDEQL